MENQVPVKLAYDSYDFSKETNPNLAPVIFLHGFAADKKTWHDIPKEVAEKTNRKAYAYDARNYGDSEFTDEYSYSLNVYDLFNFMDEINAKEAILFGHSTGAVTSFYAALQKPERIKIVIAEDMLLKPFSDEQYMFMGEYIKKLSETISSIPRSVDEKDAPKLVMRKLFHGYSENIKKNWCLNESMFEWYVPIKRDSDGRYKANYNAEALFQASRVPNRLKMEITGSYEGPTIILCGTKSHLKVYNDEPRMRRYFPNVEFIDVEGATHSIHKEFPDKTIDLIVKIINKYNIHQDKLL